MFRPNDLSCFLSADFDAVIDVRSPPEFKEDRVFNAVNLPVLNGDERARVGTIYNQESRFEAKRIGAALIARNIASHLEGWLSDCPGSFRPLVYCWRGGERSGAMAEVLGRVGWRAESLDGGYKTYRRMVVQYLHEREFPVRVVLLEGNTGTAKTSLLKQLAQTGAQTIDLEGLAGHRGSLFGATDLAQPSQKAFESAIARAALHLDPDRPVFVEAESSKVGDLQVPPALWSAMRTARRIEIRAPLEVRVNHILSEFPDYTGSSRKREEAIRKLAAYHSRDRIADWLRMSSEGNFEDLVSQLIETHYDPRYRRHREGQSESTTSRIELTGTSESELAAAAASIQSMAGLGRWSVNPQ